MFPLGKEKIEEMKAYQKKISCANACFDETVTLEITSDIVFNVSSINKCPKTTNPTPSDAAKAGRGCDKAGQPQITVIIPAYMTSMLGLKQPKIGPKSRCYDEFSATLEGMFSDIAAGSFRMRQQQTIQRSQTNYSSVLEGRLCS